MDAIKKIIVPLVLGALLAGCDKVEQPYENPVSAEIDQSLYPGDWATYPGPTFTAKP